MRIIAKTFTAVILLAVVSMALPAFAAADPAICHNGVLSDDAGQGCSDGLYNQVYGSHAGTNSGICHDGILSDDVGQGCGDSVSYTSYSSRSYSSGSGSSNSMVNPYCESSGNSQVTSPDGHYWGKYQFDYGTWVAFGGSPSAYGNASSSYQDQVAARVNYDAWPNC